MLDILFKCSGVDPNLSLETYLLIVQLQLYIIQFLIEHLVYMVLRDNKNLVTDIEAV